MNDNSLSWEQAVLWLRDQPHQRELVRACFYDDPLIESAGRYFRSTEWQAIQSLLRGCPRGKVLDIGAGRGISSYAFAKDGWNVTALEPDSSDIVGTGAIQQLADSGLNIDIVSERGEQLPFEDGTFDLVYGRAVLHHADQLAVLCREAGRVLKEKGVFLFTREHVLSDPNELQAFLDNHPLHFLYKGEHAYTLDEYLNAFADNRMVCIKVYPPYSSDINLFPSSQQEIYRRFNSGRLISWPIWLFRALIIPKMNKNNTTPGRLYSFFGRKK